MSDHVLVTRTRHLLNHRDRTITYADIARRCDVTVRFLETLSKAQHNDYGVNRVTRVYEYLAKTKLEVV